MPHSSTATPDLTPQMDALMQDLADLRAGLRAHVIGQDRVIDLALAALLSGGHALLVGLPGLGKTRLVEAIATAMGLDGKRVQFTPDLMPSDILGSEVLETADDGSRAFRFLPGPVFCQLLMADEINRASPRTQSALLQAMQEREVTIAGQARALGNPFHVLATQNPLEQEGTYPLPEAQLDRFLVQIDVAYPDRASERAVMLATTGAADTQITQIMRPEQLIGAQALLRKMPVGDQIVDAILTLVRSCRPGDDAAPGVIDHIAWGPGPRAAQALMLLVRAEALLNGRYAPNSDDLRAVAGPALAHRMALSYGARAEGVALSNIIQDAVDAACQTL